jgi:LPXTG-motif cell wall-anchored protein
MRTSRRWLAALLGVLVLGLLAGPALAQEAGVYPPPVVNGVEVAAVTAEVEAEVVEEVAPDEVLAAAAEDRLPITGSDALMLAVIGLVLLGLGGLAVRGRAPGQA